MENQQKSDHSTFPFKKVCWVFLITALCINMLAMDVYVPAMPSMVQEFNTSSFTLKLIFIVNFIEFSLSALIFGALADMKGRKSAIIGALACAFLGQFLSVFSTTSMGLFLARFVQYAGAGALSSMFITLICDTFEGHKRAKAIALFELALPLSIVFGPSMGAKLLNVIGWRGTFTAFTVIQLVCLVGVIFTLRETLQSKKTVLVRDTIKGMIALLRDPIASTLIFILGLAEGGFMIYTVLSAFFYIQVFQLSIMSYAKYQTIAVVAFLSGLFSYRFILNIATPFRIFNASIILYIIYGLVLLCFYLQMIVPTPINLCCLIVMMNFICGLISPSGNTLALQCVDSQLIGSGAATIASTNNLIVGIAMLWGNYMIVGESLMSFFGCLLMIVFFCAFLWGTFLKLKPSIDTALPAVTN